MGLESQKSSPAWVVKADHIVGSGIIKNHHCLVGEVDISSKFFNGSY